jgi:all-trans-retinol 13,14-reductase
MVQALKDRFPGESAGIERYMEALRDGRRALESLFAAHSMPHLLEKGLLWIKHDEVKRWVGRTTGQVIADCVADPKLRAILAAQWPDYGGAPDQASFGIHAVVTSSYLEGAWYPVGGSRTFASAFGEAIRAAGGETRTNSPAARIRAVDGRVQGVTLADGTAIDAPVVVSDAGIRSTLRMLPSEEVDYEWASDALAIAPSIGYFGLYLGLEGDVAGHGASSANDWFYESWDIGTIWRDPVGVPDAPQFFVTFPSLKDTGWNPGPQHKHTCEIATFIDADAFKRWEHEDMHPAEIRDAEYLQLKSRIEHNLLAQFGRHYPRLAPMVRLVISSTPLSVAAYTGAEHGAMYGLEVTPQRFLSEALRPRTPVGGLFLAGQDACCPGVIGALMGGLMAASAVEPRLLALLR